MRFSLLIVMALVALLLFWLDADAVLLGVPAWLPLAACIAIIALLRHRLPPPGVSQ